MKLHHYCSMYKTWDAEEQLKWQELLALGRWRFVLVRGVLVFGGFCFLAMTWFLLQDPDSLRISAEMVVLSNLATWACAGAIWGEIIWWGTSKSYAERFGDGDS